MHYDALCHRPERRIPEEAMTLEDHALKALLSDARGPDLIPNKWYVEGWEDPLEGADITAGPFETEAEARLWIAQAKRQQPLPS